MSKRPAPTSPNTPQKVQCQSDHEYDPKALRAHLYRCNLPKLDARANTAINALRRYVTDVRGPCVPVVLDDTGTMCPPLLWCLQNYRDGEVLAHVMEVLMTNKIDRWTTADDTPLITRLLELGPAVYPTLSIIAASNCHGSKAVPATSSCNHFLNNGSGPWVRSSPRSLPAVLRLLRAKGCVESSVLRAAYVNALRRGSLVQALELLKIDCDVATRADLSDHADLSTTSVADLEQLLARLDELQRTSEVLLLERVCMYHYGCGCGAAMFKCLGASRTEITECLLMNGFRIAPKEIDKRRAKTDPTYAAITGLSEVTEKMMNGQRMCTGRLDAVLRHIHYSTIRDICAAFLGSLGSHKRNYADLKHDLVNGYSDDYCNSLRALDIMALLSKTCSTRCRRHQIEFAPLYSDPNLCFLMRLQGMPESHSLRREWLETLPIPLKRRVGAMAALHTIGSEVTRLPIEMLNLVIEQMWFERVFEIGEELARPE